MSEHEFGVDIAERQQMEQAQRRMDELFRALIENALDVITIIDAEGVIRYQSPSVERVLGYKPAELIGVNIVELLHPDDVPKVNVAIKAAAPPNGTPGMAQVVEACLRHKDGSWRILESIGKELPGIPSVTGIVLNSRDITERKQAEEALRKREQEIRTIADNVPALVSYVDADGRYRFVNKRYEEWFGIPRTEIVGKHYSQVLGEDTYEQIKDRVETALSGQRVRYEEALPYARVGTRWVFADLVPDADDHGKVRGFFALVTDITEHKRAEEALRESEERFRTLVETAPSLLIINDAEGNNLYVSPNCEEMTGYTQEELLGRVIWWVHEDDTPKAKEVFERTFREGVGGRNFEYKAVKKNGELWYASSSWEPLKDNEGRLMGVVFQTMDVTERKRAEEKLRQSHVNLRRALEGTVHTLVSAIKMRDPYTGDHQRRVTQLAWAIAREMGLPEERIEGLRMAGLIHDLGKITVPAEILSKPSQLTELEFGLIKMHPQVGYNVLKEMDFPWPVAQIVLQHHERMDGSGYPQGLSGEEIILEAKILGVADVVEAMASHRPYRPARGIDKALEEISQNKGILYDPEVVDACLKLFAEKGFEFE